MKTLPVGLVALATALATGLGALPFLAVKKMSPAWIGISNALAGGFMLGASARLYYEGGSLNVAHRDRGDPWSLLRLDLPPGDGSPPTTSVSGSSAGWMPGGRCCSSQS